MLQKIRELLSTFKNPASFYHLLGQEEGISILVNNFYLEMETNPTAIDCLKTHQLIDGCVPESNKEKLKDFITGWLGGPNLFVTKYGHPRMRMRHGHIKIAQRERDQWLLCMNIALQKHPIKMKAKHKVSMANSFAALAMRIQNS
jgi:hemoglobin